MMLISGSVRDMDEDLSDLQDWLFRTDTPLASENKRNYSSGAFYSTVDPPGATSTPTATPASMVATSTAKLVTKSSSSMELQYYVIGVYSFIAALFAIGIVVIVARKLHKACCRRPKSDRRPHRGSAHSQDSLVPSGGHVNVNFLDAERPHQGHDSDYDYYTDEGSDGETSRPKDKPPAYEEPPDYSAVWQT